MKILIGCEESQIVCKEFRKLGFEAYSNDLIPTSGNHPEWHLQMDVFKAVKKIKPTLAIFHPDCERLTVACNKYYKKEYADRFPNIHIERAEAINFFMKLVNLKIKYKVIENPIGIMSTAYRKPDQIIQPYFFGDTERKATCLWLTNLPKLIPTNIVKPEIIYHKSGRTDSKLHFETLKLAKEERKKIRSKTFKGIAEALAFQYGNYLKINEK